MVEISDYAAPAPRPGSLFSLIPVNNFAKLVLKHVRNQPYVSKVEAPGPPSATGTTKYGLNVGPFFISTTQKTLVTLGADGDIVVEGISISRVHCAFERHRQSSAILLHDCSGREITQTIGEGSRSFRPDRLPRRVLVDPLVNHEFALGLNQSFHFRIVWHNNPTTVRVHHGHVNPLSGACTVDGSTYTESTATTPRILVPKLQRDIQWIQTARLGRGVSGTVWSGLDVDSGNAFAVKVIEKTFDPSHRMYLKREVELLDKISHPNIVEYLGSQPGPSQSYEIFLGLKDGNIDKLILENLFDNDKVELDRLTSAMLQALSYLHAEKLIHRDIKPANILFKKIERSDGRSVTYHYQLTDFGVSNFAARASTNVGTNCYMAPEIRYSSKERQTFKADIWSLLVTILYAANHCGIRSFARRHGKVSIKGVEHAVAVEPFTALHDMAATDPSNRPSAEELIAKFYPRGVKPSPGLFGSSEYKPVTQSLKRKFVEVSDYEDDCELPTKRSRTTLTYIDYPSSRATSRSTRTNTTWTGIDQEHGDTTWTGLDDGYTNTTWTSIDDGSKGSRLTRQHDQ